MLLPPRNYAGAVGKFLILVVLFAAVTYAVVWTIMRRQAAGRGWRGARTRARPAYSPSKQVAPDDDEDFLRWLERKQRSAKHDDDPPPPTTDPDPGGDPTKEPGKDPDAD